MFSLLLQDTEVTKQVLESVLESQNGKRTLSRLARTCRAVAEPAFNVLWRELDSFAPLIGLFPNHLLKRTRKSGIGLVKAPVEGDWKKVLKYSGKVRSIAYDEGSTTVASTVFRHLDDCRPRIKLLPHLAELHWRADTPAGLDHCSMFLGPDIRVISIEIGTRFPHLARFLSDIASRTTLTSFSFASPTTLPSTFTELLANQLSLQSIMLVAPGALSTSVGRWTGSLPTLKSLQLDLSGRSPIPVEGFFEELRVRSGASTPISAGTTDSGVFSDDDDDFDFYPRRKSLKGNLISKGSFTQLRKVHLTGAADTVAEFLRHIASPLTQLELVVEDPPENADWHDLSAIICEQFGESLHSLRITGSDPSRLYGPPQKTGSAPSRLCLEHFSSLRYLTRLEIDLTDSPIFLDTDIDHISKACPNLEILRLCPLSRFPNSSKPPQLSLDSLAILLRNCRQLHTLAIVLNAKRGSAEILSTRAVSSPSLQRLHVGNSWISDPLHASILLSHLAPYLETLKWFSEKNRPGFNDMHARGWQSVSETLPHLQGMRMVERETLSKPFTVPRRVLVDKGVDATPRMASHGITAAPRTADTGIQSTPVLVNRSVEAMPVLRSTAIDATPPIRHASVHAVTATVDPAIDSPAPQASIISSEHTKNAMTPNGVLPPSSLPTLLGLLSWTWSLIIASIHLNIPFPHLALLFGWFRNTQTAESVVNTIVSDAKPLALITPPTASDTPVLVGSMQGTNLLETTPLDPTETS